MPPLEPFKLILAAGIEPAAKTAYSPPPPAAGQPMESPHRAIRDCCIKLAGLLAEHVFAKDKVRIGSSMDELTVAGGLIAGIAKALDIDGSALFEAITAVTGFVLQMEAATVRTLQRRLVAEHHVRGPKLTAIRIVSERAEIAVGIRAFHSSRPIQ